MATYWYRYTLFTPRNGLRKFRKPVHSPSSVLMWTSRMPSPSSSRAHSPATWQTDARCRPISGSPLYPHHSSVLTVTIGQLARRTTASNVSPSDRSVTVSRIRPLSRPTAPQTGGRSFAQVPCPGSALARRRGGSSGSRCGTPFFPRVLVGLVGLQHPVLQRHDVAIAVGRALEPVPQLQQLGAVAVQLAGQSRRGDALGEAADDQHQLPRPPPGAVQDRPGEGVEDAVAVPAAIIARRGATTAMDPHPVGSVAARASQPIGMEPTDQLGVAGILVHQVDDREVHGRSPPTMVALPPSHPARRRE